MLKKWIAENGLLKKWIAENDSNILKWPGQSPDLKPIENLWRYLKIQILLRARTKILDLKTICEEWNKIPTKICKSSIENNKKRLVAVEENNGYCIKYQRKIMYSFLYCANTFLPIKIDKWDLFLLNQYFSVFNTYLVIMHLCLINHMKSLSILYLEIKKIKKLYMYEYLFLPTVYY